MSEGLLSTVLLVSLCKFKICAPVIIFISSFTKGRFSFNARLLANTHCKCYKITYVTCHKYLSHVKSLKHSYFAFIEGIVCVYSRILNSEHDGSCSHSWYWTTEASCFSLKLLKTYYLFYLLIFFKCQTSRRSLQDLCFWIQANMERLSQT